VRGRSALTKENGSIKVGSCVVHRGRIESLVGAYQAGKGQSAGGQSVYKWGKFKTVETLRRSGRPTAGV